VCAWMFHCVSGRKTRMTIMPTCSGKIHKQHRCLSILPQQSATPAPRPAGRPDCSPPHRADDVKPLCANWMPPPPPPTVLWRRDLTPWRSIVDRSLDDTRRGAFHLLPVVVALQRPPKNDSTAHTIWWCPVIFGRHDLIRALDHQRAGLALRP
jgi:hypothetical protein